MLSTLIFVIATAGAGELQQDLEQCRAIRRIDARVACYDAIVDSLSSPQAADESAAVDAKPDPLPPEPFAEEDFGKSAETLRRERMAEAGIEAIDELSATISSIRSVGRYRVEVTLDNGQRWRQVSDSGLKLRVGDAVTIKPAALGSFRLSPNDTRRSIKVRRIE